MAFASPTPTTELARLYFDEGLSGRVIGTMTKMSRNHVFKRLREAGYTLRFDRNTRYEQPKYKPVERPTTHDIAWAAGIYEGEGCCVLRRHTGGRRAPTVVVVQKDFWLCYRLRDLFGGSVIQFSRCTAGRTEPTTYASWRITNSARTLGFLMTIYKFLSPRRQEKIREAIRLEKEYAQQKRLERGLQK